MELHADPAPPPQTRERRSGFLRFLYLLFLGSAAAALAMYFANPLAAPTRDPRGRIFGFVCYSCTSETMAPTLESGEFLWVSTLSYALRSPEAGDVVVYCPRVRPEVVFVGRVVATPGETLAIEDGVLTIDGLPRHEPYLAPGVMARPASRSRSPERIPEGHVFILGDQRDRALDSRILGPVPLESIVGRVVDP